MKKSVFAYSLLLGIVLALVACSSSDLSIVNDEELGYDSVFAIPYENSTALMSMVFIGEGEGLRTGGDGMDWYYFPFGGHRFNSIMMHHIEIVGFDAFYEWKNQFESIGDTGFRNWRELNLRTFIEDFGLSKQDFIRAEEAVAGIGIAEIDALVIWARSIYIPVATDEDALKASIWMHRHSLSEIEALFSNDVNIIWEAFPGRGILYNGRAYSPEWILHNIERAVLEEQLPIDEIERVINFAAHHHLLTEVVSAAKAELQWVINAIR